MLGTTYLGIDLVLAKKYLEESESISRKINDDYQLGFNLALHGIVKTVAGELEVAKEKFEEGLERLLRAGDNEGCGLAWGGLAMLENMSHRYDNAIKLYQKALTSFEAVGD